MDPLRNHASSSMTPLKNTRFVVRRGNESARLCESEAENTE